MARWTVQKTIILRKTTADSGRWRKIYANRLRKNLKSWRNGRQRCGIECYRFQAMPTCWNITWSRPLRRLAVIREIMRRRKRWMRKKRGNVRSDIAATLSAPGIPPNKLVLKPANGKKEKLYQKMSEKGEFP